jgi:hypothetical protein
MNLTLLSLYIYMGVWAEPGTAGGGGGGGAGGS